LREGLCKGLIVVAIVGLVGGAVHADALGELATDDPKALDAAIHAVEIGPADGDALYAAALAADDRLAEPARALALYERLLRDQPNYFRAVTAEKRVSILRAEIGGAHSAEADALAKLVADADHAPDVVPRAVALAAAPWPGAPASLLWLAEWLRRHGRFDEALARYAEVTARWPDTREAVLARRGAAGTAVDAKQWDRAEALAAALPIADDADRATRAELLAAAHRGRLRERLYVVAWIGLATAALGLAASLALGAWRARRIRLRPPIEVVYGSPIAAVLIFASFTAHRAIGPAVTRIAVVGLLLAWLSGAALELRPGRVRALLHVVACVVGVVAIAYIALTRDGLLDMLAETVRFGPDV
jgi:hypothetical protein